MNRSSANRRKPMRVDIWLAVIAIAVLLCARWLGMSAWKVYDSDHGAAIAAIREEADRLDNDILRVTMPAVHRGQMIALASGTHEALLTGDRDLLTSTCNRMITNATEIDAVALFNPAGEIVAINTVYADGTPIEKNRVDAIMAMSFDSREIIQSCRTNTAETEVLEYQTTCDITPAFFDSSGLSIAHSIPVHSDTGELLGIISTRMRFERLTDIVKSREFAGGDAIFTFITDSGGFFDEQVNAGEEPPIPLEVVRSALDSRGNGLENISLSISKDYVLSLSEFSHLETLDSGGIFACVSVPRSWLLKHQRYEMIAAVSSPMVLLVALMLGGLGRYHTSKVLTEAKARRVVTDRLELALSGSQDAIFDWDLGRDHIYFAPRWAELLRCAHDEVGDSFAAIFQRIASSDIRRVEDEVGLFIQQAGDSIELEFRLMGNDGGVLWVLLRAAASRGKDGIAHRISGSVADISSLKSVEEQMRRMLNLDQLTGLVSRSRFIEQLEHAYVRCHRSGIQCAVLFIDFDRFKVINDTLGHNVGDELLQSIAKRLRANTIESDIVARFGGDEFVILLNSIGEDRPAIDVAEELVRACAEPHLLHGHHLVSTASIGLVHSDHATDGPSGMLRDADAAMYQAKENGKGRVVEFDEVMHQASLDRFELEEDLRRAEIDNQLSLHYQPIVHLESGIAVGAEALLRWEHPQKGFISPAEFIPIAEETNQIYALGKWVITSACRQVNHWKRSGVIDNNFRVSINLSKVQLTTPGFADELCKALSDAGLEPSELKLEVTETTIVDNRSGVAQVLRDLQSLGFVVMMDDFGTGHSSLSGLHALPINELKIDQSFIQTERANKQLIAITSSIVNLAENLELCTVGEGVESADDVVLLHDLGCILGQGFYFSKPLCADDFQRWMSSRIRKAA